MNALQGNHWALQNAVTIRQYFAASRSDDQVEAMVACFAENSVSYEPAEGPALLGHDDLRQVFQTLIHLFEAVGLQEDFISINGNEAAAK